MWGSGLPLAVIWWGKGDSEFQEFGGYKVLVFIGRLGRVMASGAV